MLASRCNRRGSCIHIGIRGLEYTSIITIRTRLQHFPFHDYLGASAICCRLICLLTHSSTHVDGCTKIKTPLVRPSTSRCRIPFRNGRPHAHHSLPTVCATKVTDPCPALQASLTYLVAAPAPWCMRINMAASTCILQTDAKRNAITVGRFLTDFRSPQQGK